MSTLLVPRSGHLDSSGLENIFYNSLDIYHIPLLHVKLIPTLLVACVVMHVDPADLGQSNFFSFPVP